MVATAIIGSGILGAGASIFGAQTAANAQTAAAQKATDAQLQMFGITRQALQPYIDQGNAAGTTVNKLLTGGANGGVDLSTLESLPGYQFSLTQGLKATQNSAAARGLGVSGAAEKGAANFATGLAQSGWENYVNPLLQEQSIGENAAAGLGSNASATGSQVGSNIIGAGNAQAGAATATGNAVTGAGNSVVSSLLINKLLGGGGASTGIYNTPLSQAGLGAVY